jgi:chemotaxis protein histidine kinase CheA
VSNDPVADALRQRYIESFQTKAMELEIAIGELQDRAAALKNLRGLAHKLSGSAGMYGFDELGGCARDLVHAIDGGSPMAAVKRLGNSLVARLRLLAATAS